MSLNKSLAATLVFFAISVIFAPAMCGADKNSNGEIVVASWNLENLFDAVDDPDCEGDDEYLPSGWTRWSEARYRWKLTNIAEIVSIMNPDILMVAEVENRRVLEDLTEVLRSVYNCDFPHIIHRDSCDMRGIDVAFIAKHEPVSFKLIRSAKGLRESPSATFEIFGRKLTIIGNHWKSRYGDKLISDAKREVMANAVRKDYTKILKRDPAAAIVVCGDFNDNVTDRIPMEAGGFSTNIAETLKSGKKLFNLSATLPEDKRGTFFYSQTKTWCSFDMINVSRGLLPEGRPASRWMVKPGTYKIFATEKQKMTSGGYSGVPYPFRRVGNRYGHKFYNGYSDHFPVMVTLEAR